MLTAMMMYAIGFAAAALIVALAVWREASCGLTPQRFHSLYMVSNAPDIDERPGQRQES